jgi:protocatechuate 3,4-dioxygenase beta subunit
MLVDLVAHPRTADATESTVLGPFHRGGAPDMPSGGNIAHLDPGSVPAFVGGRVLDIDGNPIGNALLDVWQTASNGLYDSQDPNLGDALHMRGRFRTDTDGRYLIRTVRPVHYQIPSDGPVGAMLRATGRHAWRPAHIHFAVSAQGYEPLTTHIFDAENPYLESDAVFAVKRSLICRFTRHDSPPRFTAEFDFILVRSASILIESRIPCRRPAPTGYLSPGRATRPRPLLRPLQPARRRSFSRVGSLARRRPDANH